jgi:hypothetical protein
LWLVRWLKLGVRSILQDFIAALGKVIRHLLSLPGCAATLTPAFKLLSSCWSGHQTCQGPSPPFARLLYLLNCAGHHGLDRLPTDHPFIEPSAPPDTELPAPPHGTGVGGPDIDGTTLALLFEYGCLAQETDRTAMFLSSGLDAAVGFCRRFPACSAPTALTLATHLLRQSQDLRYVFESVLPSCFQACREAVGAHSGVDDDDDSLVPLLLEAWEKLARKGARPTQLHGSVWLSLVRNLKALPEGGLSAEDKREALLGLLGEVEAFAWDRKGVDGAYSVVSDGINVTFSLCASHEPQRLRSLLAKILSEHVTLQAVIQEGPLAGIKLAGGSGPTGTDCSCLLLSQWA